MFGQYAGFIIPAYLVTAIVILTLVAWPIVIHRRRRAEIAQLEQKGVRRRSAGNADV